MHVLAAILLILFFSGPAFDARAVNELGLGLHKYHDDEGNSLFNALFVAARDGATTCKLETATGSYTCTPAGGWYYPMQGFTSDCSELSFAELSAVTFGGWTVIWDEGPGQTVVVIDFVTLEENDFPAVPTISYPIDQTVIRNPEPNPITVTWDYGADDPCQFPEIRPIVSLSHSGGTERYTMPACTTTLYEPPFTLVQDSWGISVKLDRFIPASLTITEGAWTMDYPPRLQLFSTGSSTFDIVPSCVMSLGEFKVLYW